MDGIVFVLLLLLTADRVDSLNNDFWPGLNFYQGGNIYGAREASLNLANQRQQGLQEVRLLFNDLPLSSNYGGAADSRTQNNIIIARPLLPSDDIVFSAYGGRKRNENPSERGMAGHRSITFEKQDNSVSGREYQNNARFVALPWKIVDDSSNTGGGVKTSLVVEPIVGREGVAKPDAQPGLRSFGWGPVYVPKKEVFEGYGKHLQNQKADFDENEASYETKSLATGVIDH